MSSCLFCDVLSGHLPVVGGPVYEDDLVYAYHWDDDGSGYLGHLVLMTRRHTPDFAALTPSEAQAVGLLTSRLSSALKARTSAEKVYAVFYGEATPHLHVHLTARYRDAPPEYLRWRAEHWPDAPHGDAEAIAALCDGLRAALAENPQ